MKINENKNTDNDTINDTTNNKEKSYKDHLNDIITNKNRIYELYEEMDCIDEDELNENQKKVFWVKQDFRVNMKCSFDFSGILWRYNKKLNTYVHNTYMIIHNRFFLLKNEDKIYYRDLEYEKLTIEKENYQNHVLKFSFVLKYLNKYEKRFYHKDKEEISRWDSQLKKHTLQSNFLNDFKIIKQLGNGGSSRVFLIEEKATHNLYAAKKFDNEYAKQYRANVIYELKSLRHLNHKHMIKLESVYKEKDALYFITEYVKGGNLEQLIHKKHHFTEEEASKIIKAILDLLIYLQEKHIVHRDIKTENIMLSVEDDFSSVKIVDFGLARLITDINYNQKCGTPGWIAPEILNGGLYDHKVDIFSLGIVLYSILTGTLPFYGSSVKEILQKNSECKVNFWSDKWEYVSGYAKELIMVMLEKSSVCRPSAEMLKNHPWIKCRTFGSTLQNKEFIRPMMTKILPNVGGYSLPDEKIAYDLNNTGYMLIYAMKDNNETKDGATNASNSFMLDTTIEEEEDEQAKVNLTKNVYVIKPKKKPA